MKIEWSKTYKYLAARTGGLIEIYKETTLDYVYNR